MTAKLLLLHSLLASFLVAADSTALKQSTTGRNRRATPPITCGGTAGGQRCAFPFEYNGETYTDCTTTDHNQLWCATKSGKYNAHGKWGNCVCLYNPTSVHYTCGGTAYKAACIFPFTYKRDQYYSCTEVDYGQPWCATQAGAYSTVASWGKCNCPYTPTTVSKTCGGTASDAACVFPFTYQGSQYYVCTSINHNQPWCATQAGEYSSHGKWGNCHCPTEADSESVPRTCGGSAEGGACAFPFTYNGEVYNGCTSIDHNQPWCATRAGDYHSHYLWGNCRCSSVSSTCGGNAGSRACYFPFTYQSVTHYDCTGSRPWCATRSGAYKHHGQWGYCHCKSYSSTCGGTAGGNACVFPFVFRGIKYYSCTTANHNQLWCATEEGIYENHRKWGNCVCSG